MSGPLERIRNHCGLVLVMSALSSTAFAGSWRFVAVDGKLYERLTQDAGFQGVAGVARSGSGDKLFLTGQTADGNTLLEIVSRTGVALKRFTWGPCAVDDDGNSVAWVTNVHATASGRGVVKALAFANGEAIPIVLSNAFAGVVEFSPGAAFFLLDPPNLLDQPQVPAAIPKEWASVVQPIAFLTPGAANVGGRMPRWQAVFRTSLPTKPLFRLPGDFHGSRIFTQEKQVLVFGFKFVLATGSKTGRASFQGEKAWALVFGLEGSSYKLTSQMDLSRFSGVLDVDPTSGLLLVRGKGEALARWGLFDPTTGKYKSLGRAGAHGFLLDNEFSKYLERRWN